MTERQRYAEVVGLTVRHLRSRRFLTQSELARRAVISQSTMCRIERGQGVPDLWDLRSIARVLGMSVAELVERFESALASVSETPAQLVERIGSAVDAVAVDRRQVGARRGSPPHQSRNST